MVYASLGLTHFADIVGATAEVILCSDPRDDRIPYILASCLYYLVNHQMECGWGMVVGGIENIAPMFVSETDKTSFYFGLPSILPPPVRQIVAGRDRGDLFVVTPISAAEHQLFTDKGARELEAALEASRLDPFILGRPSAV